MSLVDNPKSLIMVARAAYKARRILREVDADIGGDRNLRGALLRLDEYLEAAPNYVTIDLQRYFGES